MNQTMPELLKEWAKLEPDLCRISGGATEVRQTALGENYWQLVWAEGMRQLSLEMGQSHIQYAVQQAIVSRSYTFRLCYPSDSGDVFDGHVNNGRSYFNYDGDNPAEALLGAYLAVLRKETK